jgi:ribosome biogenesis protein MAK21
MCTEPEDADDDVENFKDAPEDDASEQEQEDAAPTAANGNQSSKSSHAYDARKRDPQFANAHKTCLWEISPLLNHFHPSVALHASQLLASVPITTTPDLELHTVSHFLDRFVYRNPKKKAEEGGKDSIMKPGAKGSDRSGMVLMRKGVGSITEGRVNADKFIEQASDKVPVDQLFFHKFFNQSKVDQAVLESKRDKRKRKDLEDVDGVDADSDLDIDDEDEEEEDEGADSAEAGDAKKAIADEEDASEGDLDEDEVWKAMQANMPDAGEDDADLLQDSGDDVDDDEVDDAEFAYSDSELGVDEDAVAADKGEVEEEEEDDEEEMEEEEPKSFFPDEEDDDELEGFAEEEDDVIDSDEDIAIDLPEFPAKAGKKSKKGVEKSGGAAEPKNKKRKLKHLPAFASADDWAEIINMGNEDEDM